MKRALFLVAGLLSCAALLGTGCGQSHQKDGSMVAPTQEAEDSRAAMQRALKDNPNMYAPTKQSGRRR